MRHNLVLALPVVAALLAAAPPAPAQTPDPSIAAAEEDFAAALGCTKQRAKAVALKAVGGGRVVFVIFDREEHPRHWSVDIVDTTHEHEVWVSVACKVIKIITGPL